MYIVQMDLVMTCKVTGTRRQRAESSLIINMLGGLTLLYVYTFQRTVRCQSVSHLLKKQKGFMIKHEPLMKL